MPGGAGTRLRALHHRARPVGRHRLLQGSAELVARAGQEGANVQVVMTEAAAAVHHAGDVQAPVRTARSACEPVGSPRAPNNMAHISLTREARCGARRRLAPTAIAEVSAWPRRRSAEPAWPGAADRALPAAGGAGDEPPRCGRTPATQRSFAQLRADSATRARPGRGDQPCSEIDDGRMRSPRNCSRADRPSAQGAAVAARADHCRPDLRADRPGAWHANLSGAARWASRSARAAPRLAPKASRWWRGPC